MARNRRQRERNQNIVSGHPSHKNRGDAHERAKMEDLELATARRSHSHRIQKRHNAEVQSDVTPGENIFVASTALLKSYSIPVHLQMNAENIPTGCFTGNNLYFDIVLNGGNYISYADHIILQLTLTNPSATDPIILGPAEQLFDKIELLINGSNIQDTIYPEQMFFGYKQDLTDERRSQVAQNYGWQRQTNRDSSINAYRLTNYGVANQTGVIIPEGETFTYYMEIPCCLSCASIFLPAIGPQKGPRYRFYPSAANCKMSTDVTLTKPIIQQAMFVVAGPQFTADVQQSLTTDYLNNRTVVPCIAFDRQIINIQPANNKETGDLTLNSIGGQVAGLMCILRRVADAQNEGLFSHVDGTISSNQTWKQFDFITFKEASGRVIGYEKEPAQLFRTVYWQDHFKSNLALEKMVLWYPFCSDIMACWKQGANTGSYFFEGSETFRFTPQSVTNATFTDGDSSEFLVFVYRHAVLNFQRGGFNLRKL